jgi:hypothetical protein
MVVLTDEAAGPGLLRIFLEPKLSDSLLKRWQRSEAPINRDAGKPTAGRMQPPSPVGDSSRPPGALWFGGELLRIPICITLGQAPPTVRALFIFGVKSSVSKESLERKKFTIENFRETSLTLVMASDSTRSSTIKGNSSLCYMATSVLSIQWKLSRTTPHSAPWIARAAFSNIATKLAREFLFQAQVRSMRSRSGRAGLTCDLLPAGESVP